jgi:uridine phosphorylase
VAPGSVRRALSPARLRPTAPIAADALLVGDPGRALLLAQELLESPKMSNHARGLWGYSGKALASGRELTIQATGMGGPSAAIVLADLAELGVRRAVRIGTCIAIEPEPGPGDLLVVLEAHAWGGSGAGEAVLPDPGLTAGLREALRAAGRSGVAARPAIVASLDVLHRSGSPEWSRYAERVDVADMQTATLLARSEALGLAVAAILIVAESASGEQAEDERIEAAVKDGGAAAVAVLSG